MSILDRKSLLDQVHQHFVIDGKAPSIDESNPAQAAFHGVFNGQQAVCSLAINDSDWLVAESFCVSLSDHREQAVLKKVLDYPSSEPFADYEVDFLDDLQVIHDDALLSIVKRFDMDFRLPFESEATLADVLTVFRKSIETNVSATRARYGLD